MNEVGERERSRRVQGGERQHEIYLPPPPVFSLPATLPLYSPPPPWNAHSLLQILSSPVPQVVWPLPVFLSIFLSVSLAQYNGTV